MIVVTGFSDEEKEILEKYLTKGMSVRDIEKEHKGYGRTRIKNIIDRYSVHSEETAKEVLKIRLAQKYHKEVSDDDLDREELTDAEVEDAYYKIMQGSNTLTGLAQELGRNRETLKGAIEEYLGDKEAILEFKAVLKQNQKVSKDRQIFFSLTPEEKKEVIFVYDSLTNINKNNASEYADYYKHMIGQKITSIASVDYWPSVEIYRKSKYLNNDIDKLKSIDGKTFYIDSIAYNFYAPKGEFAHIFFLF